MAFLSPSPSSPLLADAGSAVPSYLRQRPAANRAWRQNGAGWAQTAQLRAIRGGASTANRLLHSRILQVALILLLAFGAWKLFRHFFPAGAGDLNVYATVERGSIEDLVTATGALQPRDYVDVGAQVSGQLRRIFVDVGSEVQQGDLLAEIDAEIRSLGGRGGRAKRRGSAGGNVTDHVLEIVTKAKKISTREIKDELEGRGVVANNLAQTLAYLKRQGKVASPARSIYTPA